MQQSSVGLLGTSGRVATAFLLCLANKVGTIKRATVSVRPSVHASSSAGAFYSYGYLFILFKNSLSMCVEKVNYRHTACTSVYSLTFRVRVILS